MQRPVRFLSTARRNPLMPRIGRGPRRHSVSSVRAACAAGRSESCPASAKRVLQQGQKRHGRQRSSATARTSRRRNTAGGDSASGSPGAVVGDDAEAQQRGGHAPSQIAIGRHQRGPSARCFQRIPKHQGDGLRFLLLVGRHKSPQPVYGNGAMDPSNRQERLPAATPATAARTDRAARRPLHRRPIPEHRRGSHPGPSTTAPDPPEHGTLPALAMPPHPFRGRVAAARPARFSSAQPRPATGQRRECRLWCQRSAPGHPADRRPTHAPAHAAERPVARRGSSPHSRRASPARCL